MPSTDSFFSPPPAEDEGKLLRFSFLCLLRTCHRLFFLARLRWCAILLFSYLQLLGATATCALELGVDIGELDVTLHLGFPGERRQLL